MLSFGIDSSNYRSSAAVVFDDFSFESQRKLLFVEKGKCGLRQSDTVFLHTKQLPEVVKNLLEKLDTRNIGCIGVSSSPRRQDGSYMPCFLSGIALAETMGASLGVPVFKFSHQEGHIAAALLSAGRCDLFDKQFLALHLSGGTTEAVLVTPAQNGFECEIVGKTLDLNAGQIIDRVGVMLGLDFPSGIYLEKLAEKGRPVKSIKPCIKGFDCALSGVQNICQRLFDNNESPENIAATAMEYVISTVCQMVLAVADKYKNLPFVFSGGVMANKALRSRLKNTVEANFASTELSGDNAVGIALLAKRSLENL